MPDLTTLEALVIGPDEALVLRVPSSDIEEIDDFMSNIKDTPFAGRVLVISDEVEVSVVKAKDA